MPRFCYEVRDAVGKVVKGEADGPGHLEVILELKNLGYEIVGVWEKPLPLPGLGPAILRFFSPVSRRDLAIFSRQVAMVFGSGVPLLDALEGLAKGSSPRMAKAIEDVCKGLNQGHRLSASMAMRPDVFSTLYVSMVEAGEVSGQLEKVMDRLADFLERDMLLQKKIQSASIYPLMIFLVSLGLVLLMAVFIFPVFVTFFDGFKMELPMATQVLYTLAKLFQRPGLLAAIVVGAVAFIMIVQDQLSRVDADNRLVAEILLWAPVLGRVQREVLVARFCRVMGLLLEAGITPMVSLQASAKAVANPVFASQLDEVAVAVRDDGQSLAGALLTMPLMPRMAGSLLVTGETVGRLPKMLARLADLYDREVDTAVHRLTVLLEPLMLAIMGGIVGYILIAVFLPVYSLLDGL